MRARRVGLALLAAAAVALAAAPAWAAGPCAIYKTFATGGSFTAGDANSIQTTLGQTNMVWSCLDDYSTTAAQMQTTVDPYPAQVESLATTGQGEIERLRYLLQQIHGRTYWYQDPDPLNPPGDIQLGVASTRSGLLVFYHTSSALATSFQAGNTTTSAVYVWPLAPPTSGTQGLVATAAGAMSWQAQTVANGYTGAASFTTNGVLYGAGTGAIVATAQGGANTVLTANAGAPSWSATPIINTSVQLGVASSVTGLLKLGHASSALLTTFQAGNATQANTYVWPATSGTANQVLTTDGGSPTVALSWSVGFAITRATADVTTSETTTSTSYTDLATVGPAITLTPGQATDQMIVFSANGAVAANLRQMSVSVAIAGAAASDVDALVMTSGNVVYQVRASAHVLAAAVANGATHTLKYKVAADTATFQNRRVSAFTLN